MAIQVLGRSAEDVEQSPAARRWVAHLVHGCLTTPFDREAVRCLEERRNLPHCMDELVRRAPEREEAARQLLTDRDRP
jgi:hypothetical protein